VNNSNHTTPRYFTTLFVMVIYLIITISPLASAVLHNHNLVNAMVAEHSSESSTCRCSLEKRANHTCCCQQNAQKNQADAAVPDCCKKNTEGMASVASCTCSCGSGKVIALLKLPKSEIIPFIFDDYLDCRLTVTELNGTYGRMPTRPGEPPDPPPHLSFIS